MTKEYPRSFGPTVYSVACRLGFPYLSSRQARPIEGDSGVTTWHTKEYEGWGENEQPGVWVGWDHNRRVFVVEGPQPHPLSD